MEETLTLEFDGGSRGNPGVAGIGVVVRSRDGVPLVTLGRFIGRATNNVAEYKALIAGLEQVIALGGKNLYIRGDSELIVRQIKGQYKVRHPDLQPLHARANELLAKLQSWKIDHNLREKNKLADRLANLAMDRKAEVTDADGDAAGPDEAPAALPEPKPGDRHACPRCGCQVEIRIPTRIRPHQLRPFLCQCGMRMTAAE